MKTVLKLGNYDHFTHILFAAVSLRSITEANKK